MEKAVPLCIDCDGTLIMTDLLFEACLLLLKQNPLKFILIPFWALRGKAFLKSKLSVYVHFEWDTLPYNNDVISRIKEERKAGRKICLVTASPKNWADGISEFLGFFDRVYSTETVNLSGKNKAALLVKEFGVKGYEYAGDSKKDIKVWESSAKAIIVSSGTSLIRKTSNSGITSESIALPKKTIRHYMKALRLHQWIKNLLVFIPLLASHQQLLSLRLMKNFVVFITFGLIASAGYIINDLLDLTADRKHARKKFRPFASAVLPIWHGLFLIPMLIGCSLLLAYQLNDHYIFILISYLFISLLYSLLLKKQVIVDIVLLAGLFTMRILAGAIAMQITLSFWLLAFSMFMFLSLAIGKRFSELNIQLKQNKETAAGRGYSVNDLPILLSMGASSGIGSILVFSLYINDPITASIYPNTYWLWLLPPVLLYWVTRFWIKANRGEIDDDPLVFAIKDWQSLIIAVVCMLIGTAAVFIPIL